MVTTTKEISSDVLDRVAYEANKRAAVALPLDGLSAFKQGYGLTVASTGWD